MTDKEESERRQEEFKDRTENLMKNLEVDETLGQLLVAEGFSTIELLKDSKLNDLVKICKKNSKPLANFEDGRKSLILAESAKRSLKSKKFEKVIF